MTDPDTGTAPAVTPSPRWLTSKTWAVVTVMARAGEANPAYGGLICKVTGLGSGTVHPVLQHLIDAGWAESWMEPAHQRDVPGQPRRTGGPPRRYYRLTDAGRIAVDELAPRSAPPASEPGCGELNAARSQNLPLFRGGMTKRAVT